MAGHFISSTPSLELLSSPATIRTWTFGWGKPTDVSGTGRPSGWGPNTTGPPSVVPYVFVMAACGRARFSDDIKFWLTGAEPIRTNSKLDTSIEANSSTSRNIMAIIGGTAVRQVQRYRSIASIERCRDQIALA